MPRTRSVLVDNVVGSIFRNVTTTQQATAANVIAGSRLTTRAISGGTSSLRPALNINRTGIFFITGGLVTKLTLSLLTAARGTTVLVEMKKGLTYDTSTSVGTYEIPLSVLRSVTVTYDVSVSMLPNERLFFDIVRSGSMTSGSGLTITAGFYAG